MQLKQIMTAAVRTIRPEATIQEAAVAMKTIDAGSLPVADGDHVVGILTDRDIVTRGTAKGLDPMITKVRDLMTRDVIFAYDDQEVVEAARLMEQRRIRRLVVLSRDERLVGFVSLGDVSLHAQDVKLAGRLLERISERAGAPTLH